MIWLMVRTGGAISSTETVKPEKSICGINKRGTNMTACIGVFAKADTVKPIPVAAKANRISPIICK
jgi:hypothetical protein